MVQGWHQSCPGIHENHHHVRAGLQQTSPLLLQTLSRADADDLDLYELQLPLELSFLPLLLSIHSHYMVTSSVVSLFLSLPLSLSLSVSCVAYQQVINYLWSSLHILLAQSSALSSS